MAVARVSTPAADSNDAFEDTATVSTNTTGGNVLLALLTWNDTSGTIAPSNVMFNTSEALTHLATVHGGTAFRNVSAYYLLSPTITTANTVATWNAVFAAVDRGYLQVVVLSGVNTSAPFGTVQTVEAASGTSATSPGVTTTDADGLFITIFATESDVTSLAATGAGHAIVATVDGTGGLEWAFGEQTGSASSQTPGYSWTNSRQHSLLTIPINAAAGAVTIAPGVGSVPGTGRVPGLGFGILLPDVP